MCLQGDAGFSSVALNFLPWPQWFLFSSSPGNMGRPEGEESLTLLGIKPCAFSSKKQMHACTHTRTHKIHTIYLHVTARMLWCTHVEINGQFGGSQFSPSTMGVLGLELMWSDLAAPYHVKPSDLVLHQVLAPVTPSQQSDCS